MDTGQWDADDSRYNNWTEFSAEATAFVKSGAVDDDDKSVVLRMIEKGNADVERQSRCTETIRSILMDCAGSPFKLVEESPFCHYCGENFPGDASNAEWVCNDCSSIGCDCCGKTFGELGLDKRDIDENPGYGRIYCDECAKYRCEECMRECDMCADVVVCMECIEYHQLEECEERTTGNFCGRCKQDTFWHDQLPWCRNCNHEIDEFGRCVVTIHNRKLGSEIVPKAICSICDPSNPWL